MGRVRRRALRLLAHQGPPEIPQPAGQPVDRDSGTDPDNSYRYLEIRGTVARIDDDPANAFIDSMAKKYMGVDAYPFHQPGDERVVVRVAPDRTTHMG